MKYSPFSQETARVLLASLREEKGPVVNGSAVKAPSPTRRKGNMRLICPKKHLLPQGEKEITNAQT